MSPMYLRGRTRCDIISSVSEFSSTRVHRARTRHSSSGQAAIEFLWSGQAGWFELAFEPNRRELFELDEALKSLYRMRFFAPLARKTRGSTKEDVNDHGNVVWADIDS